MYSIRHADCNSNSSMRCSRTSTWNPGFGGNFSFMFSVYNTIVLRPRYQGICLSACFLYLLLGTQRLLYLIGQIKSLEMMLVSCTSFFFFWLLLEFSNFCFILHLSSYSSYFFRKVYLSQSRVVRPMNWVWLMP